MINDAELDQLIAKRGILKGLNSTLGITAIVMVLMFILYTVLLGKPPVHSSSA